MSISYDYDLSKESQLQFEYHLNDIQQLDDGYQQLNQQVTKINQIITLFNEKDNQELIQKTLNDLKINGVKANDDNVVANKYPISRPFLVVNKKDSLTDEAKGFIDFIKYNRDNYRGKVGESMRKIAVLTSGGDAPGMNGAIRAIVRVGIKRGFEVYGVYEGYKGLVAGNIKKLGYSDVSEILSKGGTILESSRLPSFKEDKVQEQAIHQLKQRGIDGLVVIGGDGSYKGALALSQKGIDCIAIPGTIDNDINGTDETIGFHTALYNIIDAVNKLRDTSSSHHRCFVVEVMGNHADNLAIYSAIACGSEIVITDKTEYDENKIIEELKICEEEYHKKHAILIVSEKILDVEKLANRISEETGYSGRSIVLGHIQRGGSPVPEDRILASKMAEEAICLLEKRKSGLCICMKDNQIISKNIEEALIEKNENQDRLYQLFLDLA